MTHHFIFDLDGTLVDTAPDLRAALNVLLLRAGRREVDAVEIRHLVGRGARNLIAQAFRETGAPRDPAGIDALYADFLKEYGARIADASRPFPGVVETLETLQKTGARLAVLTNKPHDSTLALLAALDLMRFFGAVDGAGRKPYLKPDPRLIADVLAELGGDGPAIMVGDSITDVELARAAGIPVILMSYGYTPEPAATLGADAVLDDFRDVPDAAHKLLRTQYFAR
jgi:phosphoglycolate phosphatase